MFQNPAVLYNRNIKSTPCPTAFHDADAFSADKVAVIAFRAESKSQLPFDMRNE